MRVCVFVSDSDDQQTAKDGQERKDAFFAVMPYLKFNLEVVCTDVGAFGGKSSSREHDGHTLACADALGGSVGCDCGADGGHGGGGGGGEDADGGRRRSCTGARTVSPNGVKHVFL